MIYITIETDEEDLFNFSNKKFDLYLNDNIFSMTVEEASSQNNFDSISINGILNRVYHNPTFKIVAHGYNKKQKEIDDAKAEVRTAQKAFKEAQRKLSELTKGAGN